MRYSEWRNLTPEEKKNTSWKKHPHIRTATIFSILFAIVFAVFLLRVFQNRRIHVNRKPNDKEAFAIAKEFVKQKLKQPSTSVFPKNDFTSTIDTATNSYQVRSTLKTLNDDGKMVRSEWKVNLIYTGGDWADKKSWQLKDVTIAHN
ncbi:hypothetical protein [Mucilaginibacter segetis]|uniref:Cytochrome oxidase complex assembly protein 1 n=1 Tax=Mucilaginibacter segetis TaxID=2793071 RepID=A0A934PRM6_9SPHI|nr:hypothetical protein [Mucilaginibacter segetis]MBK0379519.1 hypothetical protein [Mucilaginibacter segetis]